MISGLKEKFLLFAIRNRRDPQAFGKLYDLYLDRIYRFIYFKVSSKEEAQDLTSEVFLRAWQYLGAGHQVSYLSALLYRIARNLVTDFYRQNTNKQIIALEDTREIGDRLSNLKKLELRAEADAVYRALNTLSGWEREVITLRHIEGLSIGEISEALEKKEGHVRVILHRAMNNLKSKLQT